MKEHLQEQYNKALNTLEVVKSYIQQAGFIIYHDRVLEDKEYWFLEWDLETKQQPMYSGIIHKDKGHRLIGENKDLRIDHILLFILSWSAANTYTRVWKSYSKRLLDGYYDNKLKEYGLLEKFKDLIVDKPLEVFEAAREKYYDYLEMVEGIHNMHDLKGGFKIVKKSIGDLVGDENKHSMVW